MSFLRTVALIAAVGVAYHFWHERKTSHFSTSPGIHNPGPFVATAMPDGAKKNTVLILAPLNCPSAAAKRADALAEQLNHMSIPTERGNSFSLHIQNPTPEQQAGMEQAAAILGGEIPAVFVNGMGKSNPTADEAAEAYRLTQ